MTKKRITQEETDAAKSRIIRQALSSVIEDPDQLDAACASIAETLALSGREALTLADFLNRQGMFKLR